MASTKALQYLDSLFGSHVLPSFCISLREKYGSQLVSTLTPEQIADAFGCTKCISNPATGIGNGGPPQLPTNGGINLPTPFANIAPTPLAETKVKKSRVTCSFKPEAIPGQPAKRKCCKSVITGSQYCEDHAKLRNGGPPPLPNVTVGATPPGLTPAAIHMAIPTTGPPPLPNFNLSIPSMPPGIPGMPGIPISLPPTIPGLPSAPPTIPGLPSAPPTIPGLPATPSPALPPTIPGLPATPSPALPPSIPAMPPALPQVGLPPTIPGLPVTPSPALPQAPPTIPAMPPALPQVGLPPTIPGLPQAPISLPQTTTPAVEVAHGIEALSTGEIILENNIIVKHGPNGSHESTGMKMVDYKLPTEKRIPITPADEQLLVARGVIIPAKTPALPVLPPNPAIAGMPALPPMPPM